MAIFLADIIKNKCQKRYMFDKNLNVLYLNVV